MTYCNVCGCEKYRILYSKNGNACMPGNNTYEITKHIPGDHTDIAECLDCGFVYTVASNGNAQLLKEYMHMKDEAYVKEASGRRKSAKRVLKEIAGMKKPGTLLDVGSACGFFLDEARKSGWQAAGIEPSKWAAGYARDNFALDITESSLEAFQGHDLSFDVVTMTDVIEHLQDPKAALERVRKLLKHDGILYIATPDIRSLASRIFKSRWWGIKRHHLSYFSRDSLNKLFRETGFEPVKNSFYLRYFSIGYLSRSMEAYNGKIATLFKRFLSATSLVDKNILLDLCDQMSVYARKRKILDDIVDSEHKENKQPEKMKTVIVLPAYNAAKTLSRTVSDIPEDMRDAIMLVDDNSSDDTVKIAKELGLSVFTHDANLGYGGNQKTCYEEALKLGADIVVMLHPDYQYDPKLIPELIRPIKQGNADCVFGSRMMKGGALEGGMPRWKHNANILLTALENVALGTYLTEYHSGFRAYSARVLEAVNFDLNSNGFIFDTEIIVQVLLKRFKIEEIPIKTRYFDEASSISFSKSCFYGFGIIKTLFKHLLHTKGIFRFKQFE